MSNKKILAVDLDDTLFNDDKSVSEENIKALNDLLDAGNILAVDTGRPTHVIKTVVKSYDVFFRDNVYLLGFQGTHAVKSINNDILFGHYLDTDAAIEIVKKSIAKKLTTIVFEYGNIYTFWNDDNVVKYAEVSKEPITVIDSPEELRGHQLTKFMVIDFKNHSVLHDFEKENAKEANEHFTSMFSNVAFLEYVVKGASKGDGLMELARILGVDKADTVACGDERNDISMVEAAGIGCAVSNGRDELKAVADYITQKDNNNGAVAEVIRKFIL